MENNKRFLIDTQIFIWWMENSERISKKLYDLLNNPHNEVFLSAASVWELVIKKGKKKLKGTVNIQEGIKASNFSILSIEIAHVLGVEKLPHIHKDPFDRILIAQSQVENVTLITSDEKIMKYKVSAIKAG